ncbi:CD276 antigen-like [Anabas testudineus]|uniref:CD276 antigen-like n=1 Tax=Anabas testudineus TaxID=64144 RepID=UPI000E457514|nr:CD276 antigen-like [Anabas testudineus]
MGKAFLSAFFCVFHCVPKVFLLLEVSSANISINGTRGDPLLWSCHYIFSEPFQPEQSLIFWQGYKKMDIVLHIYRKGQQEFHYQSQSFQNRTTVFPDQLPSGNFSLVIEPLMLQDNQIFIEVIFLSENKPTKKLCQTTVYVAAPFQEPKIEMNQKEKTATCSTKGGFPEPVIRWMSGNGGTKVGLSEATMISEEDNGTFSVSSTVIITGLKKVICEIYNPTLNQTLIATEDVPTPKNPVLTAIIIIIISVIFYIVILPGLIIYQYIKQQRRGNKSDREHEFVDPPKDKERQRPGNECDRHQLYEHPLEKGGPVGLNLLP